MKKVNHSLEIGSRLYWVDAPDTLAGIVTGFTPKRDVIIIFVSGHELGEKSYPISLAKGFIVK